MHSVNYEAKFSISFKFTFISEKMALLSLRTDDGLSGLPLHVQTMQQNVASFFCTLEEIPNIFDANDGKFV